jgi:hypothetical protein
VTELPAADWGPPAVWREVPRRPRPTVASVVPHVLRALIATAVLTALGAPLGLIWAAWRPNFNAAAALIAGDDSAFETSFGSDLRFGVVVLVGGVVLGIVAGLVAARQPRLDRIGLVVGLAVGGCLGALVAVHVGELAAHPSGLRNSIDATLRALPPHQPFSAYTSASQQLFLTTGKFHLRAWPLAGLFPLATLAGFVSVTALTDRRTPTPSWD